MAKVRTVRDIDEMADSISDRHLACRVDNHSKVPSSIGKIADMDVDDDVRNITGSYAIKTLRCRNRCGVVWFQVLSKEGQILWETGADYSQAPGYLVHGLGRLTRDDRDRLRKEQIERALERGGI